MPTLSFHPRKKKFSLWREKVSKGSFSKFVPQNMCYKQRCHLLLLPKTELNLKLIPWLQDFPDVHYKSPKRGHGFLQHPLTSFDYETPLSRCDSTEQIFFRIHLQENYPWVKMVISPLPTFLTSGLDLWALLKSELIYRLWPQYMNGMDVQFGALRTMIQLCLFWQLKRERSVCPPWFPRWKSCLSSQEPHIAEQKEIRPWS